MHRKEKVITFALAKAQMAESVDALVSNTSGAIHPGSIPGLGTELRILIARVLSFFSCHCLIELSTVGLSHHFIQKAQMIAAAILLWN